MHGFLIDDRLIRPVLKSRMLLAKLPDLKANDHERDGGKGGSKGHHTVVCISDSIPFPCKSEKEKSTEIRGYKRKEQNHDTNTSTRQKIVFG